MSNTNNRLTIIGGGFSSLSAACYLAQQGYEVTLLEKNATIGGRARQFHKDGFTFDMGPSFYWMPDVFESFFNDFGKSVSDYYDLVQLDPGYQVYFAKGESISIAAQVEEIKKTFEGIEPGSSVQLSTFLGDAKSNYEIAVQDLVYQPGESLFEIVNWETFKRLGLFVKSISQDVAKSFKNSRLRTILEFPVLFLGAKPDNTPAFYNFMNYADFGLGTWYPMGGMHKVVEGMQTLAESLGVKMLTNAPVQKINLANEKVASVETPAGTIETNILLSGADYAHTESLLPENNRQYSDSYWDDRTLAPSALMFYMGFDKKLENVNHHTLFFDTDFPAHAATIYDKPEWPEDPLFYASFPSITDPEVAPAGQEAGIFLIPIAPGIDDPESIRQKYFEIIIERLESVTDQSIREHVLFSESYSVSDFTGDYNSLRGNAYGLANTLFQTHVFRPRLKSKKVDNLYFTGQLTLPGPGVPPSIISGKIVSNLIRKYHEIQI